MTEFLHHPQNEFALTLDLLGITVLDPNKEFVVLEQPHDSEAQQKEDPAVPGAEGLTYLVIERDIHMVTPGSAPRQTEDRQWATGRGAEAAIPRPLDEATREQWRQSGLPMERGGGSAHTWLLTTFFEKAQTPEDLAYVLKFGFEQTAQLARHHRQTLGMALQAGVIKSLRFATEPTAYVIPEAIGHALNTLGTSDTKWARAALQRQLTNALTGAVATSPRVRKEMRATSNALMLQGVRLYENAGLLDDSFWVQTGIKEAGNVADLPEFLAMVHAKLTGPDGEQIVSRIKDQRGAGRSYITSILEHCVQDPQRHQANAQRVLSRTHAATDVEEHKVDLFLLVKEANRLAAAHNGYVDLQKGGQDEKYPILGSGADNYADAFLRVLSIMRDPKRDPHVRTEQLEQDNMHADIISVLFTGQNRRDQSLRANLSLRFPDISPRQLRIAQEMAARGIALRSAIEQAIKEGDPQQEQEGDANSQG